MRLWLKKACWFKKTYELIIGNKVFSDKIKIYWEALVDQFVNEERGNRRETIRGDLGLIIKRALQAQITKPLPRKGEQLFKNYADLFFNRKRKELNKPFLSFRPFLKNIFLGKGKQLKKALLGEGIILHKILLINLKIRGYIIN